ncbi:MAG: type II toxin-antitoxin system VapC family toxin [Blastocatellia bacterium]
MYVLDTDHMSALEWGSGAAGQRLITRLNKLSEGEAATTIITFEEQTRGWLAVLAQSRSLDEQVDAYRRLKRLLDNYLKTAVLEFDAAAAAEFQRLQRLRLRVGTMDLKVAAIVLAHDATVLTRNTKDFSRVPDLRVEDWTA